MVDLKKRCPTGIPGLDELIEGGYPRGRTVLVSGTCGTGKTTFGIQFLYEGITKHNEPGIMVILEEESKELKEDMLRFGFDLDKAEKDGKLIILTAGTTKEINLMDLSMSLPYKAKELGAKRCVIDSLTAISFIEEMEGNADVQKIIVSINKMAKEAGLTTLLLSEIPEGSEMISRHGVESHIADGVLVMGLHQALDSRILEVRKMRGTKHSIKHREIKFGENGLEVLGETKGKPKKAVFL